MSDPLERAVENAHFVRISRPQYEALMAAAKALPNMLFDFADDDARRETCAALAALKAAGIQMDGETS